MRYDETAGYPANDTGYDRVGNRRTRAVTSFAGVNQRTYANYDANDRLGPLDGTKVAAWYDENGNIVQFNFDGNDYWDQTVDDLYDYENRLIEAIRPVGAVSILYDGDGNRVRKTVNGATTWYLADDRNPTGYAQVLQEMSVPNGAPLRTYIYGLDLVSQKDAAGTVHYYGYDGHGSVRFLTDGKPGSTTYGQITDTYTYDAFGILIDQQVRNPSSGSLEPVTTLNSQLSTLNWYLYAGEQWDPDLGLYYNRARYYNPDLGRFWTMDTYEGNQEEPLTLNNYLYCSANPVNNIDPNGELAEAEIGGLALRGMIEGLRPPAVAIAKREAERQLIKGIAKLLTSSSVLFLLKGDEEEKRIPTMYYSKSEFKNIAPKIELLQLTHPEWKLLHYIGIPYWRDLQRDLALRKVRGRSPGSGNSWDEYPFATTFEGGSQADVQAAPTEEQSKQGGKHTQFYLAHRMLVGDPFYVKVIP